MSINNMWAAIFTSESLCFLPVTKCLNVLLSAPLDVGYNNGLLRSLRLFCANELVAAGLRFRRDQSALLLFWQAPRPYDTRYGILSTY